MGYLEKAQTIDKKLAGIYLISNTANNKHYVGQSIYLRKRLIKHYYNWKSNQYDCPLYRAFTKYGIDAFEISLLWTTESTEYNKLKSTLDALEKKYIQEYHSYGEYNQTLEGDASVTGYKFTEKQREKIIKSGRYAYVPIYMIDTTNGWSRMSINITIMLEGLGLPKTCRSSISRCKNSSKLHLYKGRYIFGNTYQECKEKYNEYLFQQKRTQKKRTTNCKIPKGNIKYTLDQILQLLFKYKSMNLSVK